MKDLSNYNVYQQLLLSALAIVDEADLVAIFRAARGHRHRDICIDLMNAELDKGHSLMEILGGPNALHEHFEYDMPELRVSMGRANTIMLEFGTHDQDAVTVYWEAEMAATGVVKSIRYTGDNGAGKTKIPLMNAEFLVQANMLFRKVDGMDQLPN